MEIVLYEDKPKYTLAFRIILGLVFLSWFVDFITSKDIAEAVGVLLGFAIVWTVFPRKYQLLEDRIKIVLGRPFSFNIRFETIDSVKGAKWSSFGWSFATSLSPKGMIEIVRKRKLNTAISVVMLPLAIVIKSLRERINVLISPSNRELFLEELNKAIASWKRSHGVA